MSTAGNMLLTSSARPLQLRMRPDLVCKRARYEGTRYWLVKDPVGLRYFRFQDEEFALLQFLDGQHSLDEIKELFEASFRPQKITIEELQRFIGHLHASGLVLSHNPGQGEKLLERAKKRRRQQQLQFLANILFVKFPGIDPERALRWLYPKVRWFFTPSAVWGALVLMLAALTLVVINFDQVRGQPEFQKFSNFFNIHNVVWLWIALGVVKIIHEFGHGLTCTHFGGECHEMGVLFLVLTPCLYCNVSDSWMMPNKWHRIWISAAGIYVEVVMASLATFVWWFSGPGMIHNLAFSTMFVCSVSTIVFNANPLLRYDGYYVLMDLLEIPNLRTKSAQLLQRAFGKWCLGVETPEDPFMPDSRRWAFVLYAIASYLYRWVVTFGILWFLYHFLGSLPEPWNKLRSLSWVLAAGALTTLIVVPAYRLGTFLFSPGRTVEVKKLRIAISVGVVAAVVGAFLLLPLPLRVRCSLTIEPHEAGNVYVQFPGMLQSVFVRPGEQVRQGRELAQLVNVDLEAEMEQLAGQRNQRAKEVGMYRELGQFAELQAAQQALDDLDAQIRTRRSQQDQLRLKAPRDGIVVPPPYVPEPDPFLEPRPLAAWHRTPLEEQNLGAYLEAGVLFCAVAPPKQWEAVLVIGQADYKYVRPGQKVWIKLEELQDQTLEGTIEKISSRNLQVAPPELSSKAGGELPTQTGPGGMERPTTAYYQASVPLEDDEGLLRPGFRGRAKIAAGSRTYAQWLWRLVTETFHFRM